MMLNYELLMEEHRTLDEIKKIKHAKKFVDQSISLAAKKFASIIAINPINAASYPLLLAGLAPKSKELTQRTYPTGLFAGYILKTSEEHHESYINLKNRNLQAIKRNNSELWLPYDQIESTDEVIMALSNDKGEYITSDVDILLIATQEAISEDVFFEQDYGYITEQELIIVKYINQLYNELTYNYSRKKREVSIITHGPYNRHNKSSREELKFPVQIFMPDGINLIGTEHCIYESLMQLESFLMQNRTFKFRIPEHWKSK